MSDLRIYIHIPFCKQRCAYCDFTTYDDKSYLIESYFEALGREIDLYAPELEKSNITSVFFGGGTPTYPDAAYLKDILDKLQVLDDIEITVEANPGTVDYDKLAYLREAGVNRISFGVQSFENDTLIIMGRIHDRMMAVRNINDAKRAGFDNISIDLMHGYPLQKEEGFRNSLKTAVDLGVNHISCYSLKVCEDTPLCSMLDKNLLPEPDDEADRIMYRAAMGYLKSCGFSHYEIANFARPGYECRHNIGYWVLDEYIGLGAGAHSYHNKTRFSNATDLGEYIRKVKDYKLPRVFSEDIDEKESISEFMILGLRMLKGINIDEFNARFNKDVLNVFGNEINDCINSGLMIHDNKNLRLTVKGLDFANKVFRAFI